MVEYNLHFVLGKHFKHAKGLQIVFRMRKNRRMAVEILNLPTRFSTATLVKGVEKHRVGKMESENHLISNNNLNFMSSQY